MWIRIWKFSLEKGDFAASCPSEINDKERDLLLEFIDLIRRQLERPANADVTGGREADAGSSQTEGRSPGEAMLSGQTT
jgi:hypothetical protein